MRLDILKINPGSFSNNITVSNTLVPLSDKVLTIGKVNYEFLNVFIKIETSDTDIEFSANGDSVNLTIDQSSENLTLTNSVTLFRKWQLIFWI